MLTSPFLILGDHKELHLVGSLECNVGGCGYSILYPYTCDCGGLVHSTLGDKFYYDDADDYDYVYHTKCDRCGLVGRE